MTRPALTDEQVDAIQFFAKQHGRRWKFRLSALWMRAAADPILHNLRNTHGPTWLMAYRLSPVAPD